MKTKMTSKILAVALIATSLSAATSSAFADEYISAQNKESYAVAAGRYDDQATLPANAEPTSYERGAHPHGTHAPAIATTQQAPVSGPFSDTDPHSGPAHND